jgi:hypothetical protein
MKNRLGICRVCYLVENDAGLKSVEFCKTCNAWICKPCEPNLYRRGLAATVERGLEMITLRKKKENKWVGIAIIVISALSLFILSH